jgi:pyrroline-5-carboxylate reductase
MTDLGRMPTVAVLGAGKIGESLLAGLLADGHPAEKLMFVERVAARSAEVAERHGIAAVDVRTAADTADMLVVAVKPQDIEAVLSELAPAVGPDTLLVSLCAGLPSSLFAAKLPAGTPVVRVMPNTPMTVGQAMCAISPGAHATEAHLEDVENLLRSVGDVVRVPESQQDTVTAISGSGPAYFFYLIEAMIDAGVLLGLPRATATRMVTQVALGSARMLSESGEHPALLREAVTSPGGTTAVATRELERHGVRAAMLAAVEAARDRSVELGSALSADSLTSE